MISQVQQEKSKEKYHEQIMRLALIKEVGDFLDSLVSLKIIVRYHVKRDFGMNYDTIDNLCVCKDTISLATLDKMAYVMAFYLMEYQKATEAEPLGQERKQKLDALPALVDKLKGIFGFRAAFALDLINKGIDLRQVVKHG